MKYINNQIYHIFNRSVRRNKLYLDKADYTRWEKLLYWCNQYKYSYSSYLQRLAQCKYEKKDPKKIISELNLLKRYDLSPVEILAFTELPNHYHLIVKQTTDNGISTYMHRVATSFSKYFNMRHEVTGVLFESTFKSVRVKTDEQLIQLSRYIHLNPIVAGLASKRNLVSYRWSSWPYYMGKRKNVLLTMKHLLDYFTDIADLEKFTLSGFDSDELEMLEGLTHDDDFGIYRGSK